MPKYTPVEYKGKHYNRILDLCLAYDIDYQAFMNRYKRGHTIEDCITFNYQTRKTNVTDHKGKKYATDNDMARAYGITGNTYRYRIGLGLSIKQALTTPIGTRLNGLKKENYTMKLSDLIDCSTATQLFTIDIIQTKNKKNVCKDIKAFEVKNHIKNYMMNYKVFSWKSISDRSVLVQITE